MKRHLSGTLILVLLTSLRLSQAQETSAANPEPFPPTSDPPHSLDQPAPAHRPTRLTPADAEPVETEVSSVAPDESAERKSSKRNKLPVYIVFLGLILLFVRMVLSQKR